MGSAMRIAIASDHAAIELKAELAEWLINDGHDVADLGPEPGASVDYPDSGYRLAEIIADLGIGREAVMAVGDSVNDLDMIEYAGWGVAMGNASPQVKAAAKAVTAANDADGVAAAIEQYVLKKTGVN